MTISALKKINYQREEGGWQREATALPYFTVSTWYKEINNAQNNNKKTCTMKKKWNRSEEKEGKWKENGRREEMGERKGADNQFPPN